MTPAARPDDDEDPDASASSPAYICGYPTSRGGACQHPVAHPDGRCHHHPHTVLEALDDD